MKQSFTFVVVGCGVWQVHASVPSVLKSSKYESSLASRHLDATHQYPRGKGGDRVSQGVWLRRQKCWGQGGPGLGNLSQSKTIWTGDFQGRCETWM